MCMVICLVNKNTTKKHIVRPLIACNAVCGRNAFTPSSPGQLAGFCARIGESVPAMPVYFYHIPVLTGVSMPMY